MRSATPLARGVPKPASGARGAERQDWIDPARRMLIARAWSACGGCAGPNAQITPAASTGIFHAMPFSMRCSRIGGCGTPRLPAAAAMSGFAGKNFGLSSTSGSTKRVRPRLRLRIRDGRERRPGSQSRARVTGSASICSRNFGPGLRSAGSRDSRANHLFPQVGYYAWVKESDRAAQTRADYLGIAGLHEFSGAPMLQDLEV